MDNCLRLFEAQTAEWFEKTLGGPTPVQELAWPAIAAGGHVLVSAPTGTGKTLSAFLVFLDRMKKMAEQGTLERELCLIYVSPLKSLAADIRENLKKPLSGIGAEGLLTIGIRTGDTTQSERQKMVQLSSAQNIESGQRKHQVRPSFGIDQCMQFINDDCLCRT